MLTKEADTFTLRSMKALIQRVSSAQVTVDGKVVGKIGPGILTLLGVAKTDVGPDTEKKLDWLISKILKLRIFEDDQGKMNLSLQDKGYEHLIVSQFTLCGDPSKGNRPSFIDAAAPEDARKIYERAIEISRAQGTKTEGGQFQAHMKVELINDGPVTFMLEI